MPGLAKTLFLIAVALLVTTEPASAQAAGAAGSCVDLNDDGHCDENEPPLAPLLDASGNFDTSVAQPGYTPPSDGQPVGIVLNDFPITGDLTLTASGTVVVNGRLMTRQFAKLTISADVIDIGRSGPATIDLGRRAKYDSGWITLDANTVNIGARSTLTVVGDENQTDITSNVLNIGDGVRFVQSGLEASLEIDAGLTIGKQVHMSSGQGGEIGLNVYGTDIVATNLRARAASLNIIDTVPCGDELPHRIAFADSDLVVTSREGRLIMEISGCGAGGTDTITLTHTHIAVPPGAIEYFVPTPTVVR